MTFSANTKPNLVSRRTTLKWFGSFGASVSIFGLRTMNPSIACANGDRRTGMGLVIYDLNHRRRWLQQNGEPDLFEPINFLRHCHQLGTGGMQARLGQLERDDVRTLREFAEQNDLYIEAIVSPPGSEDDVGRFEAEIHSAVEVGAIAARTVVMPGRRYERFQRLEEFREFESRATRMLERAAPIVERYEMPLAVENHKDQRIDERVKLFESIESEFVGACVDTGNSFALLDGAFESVEALAPFAFSVHLKDQALKPYDEGFLLGDIALGQGSFDLVQMVESIRRVKPNVRFSLELITRDPLRVPCLTDSFFLTMPNLPAVDLVKTMNFVNEHTIDDLQFVSDLSLESQVELEERNVSESIRYASEVLKI